MECRSPAPSLLTATALHPSSGRATALLSHLVLGFGEGEGFHCRTTEAKKRRSGFCGAEDADSRGACLSPESIGLRARAHEARESRVVESLTHKQRRVSLSLSALLGVNRAWGSPPCNLGSSSLSFFPKGKGKRSDLPLPHIV